MRSDAKTSQASEVTYSMILKNRRSMMAILSAIFAMIFMLFFDSILTVHLIKDMNRRSNIKILTEYTMISISFVPEVIYFITDSLIEISSFKYKIKILVLFSGRFWPSKPGPGSPSQKKTVPKSLGPHFFAWTGLFSGPSHKKCGMRSARVFSDRPEGQH